MALLERVVVREAKALDSVDRLPPGTRYVPEHPLTVDEFYELIDESSPAELDEGAIVMPSPVSIQHEDCRAFLLTLLRVYVNRRKLGMVLGSRTKARLSLRAAREPDILFVAAARRERVRKLEIDGGPDLVVEIINSGKGRSEALAKVPQYERAGVAELWLIDLPRRVLSQRMLESGTFQERTLSEGETLESATVSGFRLPVSVLFSSAGAYPSEWEILEEMLREG